VAGLRLTRTVSVALRAGTARDPGVAAEATAMKDAAEI